MSAKAQDELRTVITQQVQQEMVQAQQQPQQENPAFATTQGQGWNPAEGGRSPYQAAPNQTRETITGETMTGEETAPV